MHKSAIRIPRKRMKRELHMSLFIFIFITISYPFINFSPSFRYKTPLIAYVCLFSRLSQGKPDLNTALPIRQTASIFKQPVTKVVNHPNNKVKTDLQRATEQPRQVSALDSALFDFLQIALVGSPYYGHVLITSYQ